MCVEHSLGFGFFNVKCGDVRSESSWYKLGVMVLTDAKVGIVTQCVSHRIGAQGKMIGLDYHTITLPHDNSTTR